MADVKLTGTIVKEKCLTGSINKGIGMGELPSARGLGEFPSPAYSVNGTDLIAVGEAIAEKAGVEKPAWPDGWKEAVEGIELPQEPLFNASGKMYFENMRIKTTNGGSMWTKYCLYHSCTQMKSVESYGDPIPAYAQEFNNCTSLESAILPTFTSGSTQMFAGCKNLTKVQLGSIGMPVTSMDGTFSKTNNPMELTLYVEDDATLPLTNSPFGNVNAIIIYRSATTGEVIEV